MSGIGLIYLVRPGCHLCDDARPLVAAEAARAGLRVDEVDIEGDDRLLRLYGLRIPVLLSPDEEVVAEGVIDDRRVLRKALAKLGRH